MTRAIFTKSYPVPNYEGGRPTILKRQISQKIFTSEFMLPDSKNFFDALVLLTEGFLTIILYSTKCYSHVLLFTCLDHYPVLIIEIT